MHLRLILGDQLTHDIASLRDAAVGVDVVLMAEVRAEATYVKHHKKKIAFLFSAMRHFAEELRAAGHTVVYVPYDAAENTGSLQGEVKRLLAEQAFDGVVVTKPGEYRLLSEMEGWADALGVPVELRDDDRFLCEVETFAQWAEGRKQLRMEYFYREMRKRYGVLMEDGKPVGGEWNYDQDNRQKAPADLQVPAPYTAPADPITQKVLELVAREFDEHFGDLEPFTFAVTRDAALEVLDRFVEGRLAQFGPYQDAMVQGEPWMFHSHISFYLNCGLLLPMECIRAAERAYYDGRAPLNSVEGFIRQILGWREYIRGIYWLSMPEYAQENFLRAERDLPAFFWSGETRMNCLRQCVLETKRNAYAHHIQRLMVLGNFALIAGLAPEQVNEWYLLVYADAYEWVELPNVSGMILFADGGVLASKPYAASGAYIHKMSNYCETCSYSPTKKNGGKACPFNYLYWNFLERNADLLSSNPRLAMIYRSWGRMSDEKRTAVADDSARFFNALERGDEV